MPIARHQLDCCICLAPSENTDVQALHTLAQDMREAQKAGLHVPTNSFSTLIVEQHPKPKLYANHQGGYRVFCHVCKENIAKDFSRAVEMWRGGSERSMECPFCMQRFALEEVQARPELYFSCAAIVLRDVERAELGSFWEQRITQLKLPVRIIFRRIG